MTDGRNSTMIQLSERVARLEEQVCSLKYLIVGVYIPLFILIYNIVLA